MRNTPRIIVITLLTFGVYFFIDEQYFKLLRECINDQLNNLGISHLVAYIIVGIPIGIGTILIHKNRKICKAWGLSKGLLSAILFAFLCTLPMFVGYATVFNYDSAFSLNAFIVTVLCAAFFEELYFRGFLFGQIFRYTQWGFFPSIVIGAVLFGLVHLYQGSGLSEIVGIFLITFMGGILYGWVFVEWDDNLWVPIFLHLFMNLSWGMFSAGENALGGLYSNIFRIATIVLIIILTIYYKRKLGKKLIINKNTIWMKNENWLQKRM